MGAETLYIIGNGFDIYHGIHSKYSDFREYVSSENSELFDLLEKYFPLDEKWSDFEEVLAELDVDYFKENSRKYLVPYGAEDWSDSNHHDYQNYIEECLELLSINLKEILNEWVVNLTIPNFSTKKKLNLITNSLFLNFNYTKTLENVYKINENNIKYIHNKAINKNSELILGHSRIPKQKKSVFKKK